MILKTIFSNVCPKLIQRLREVSPKTMIRGRVISQCHSVEIITLIFQFQGREAKVPCTVISRKETQRWCPRRVTLECASYSTCQFIITEGHDKTKSGRARSLLTQISTITNPFISISVCGPQVQSPPKQAHSMC